MIRNHGPQHPLRRATPVRAGHPGKHRANPHRLDPSSPNVVSRLPILPYRTESIHPAPDLENFSWVEFDIFRHGCNIHFFLEYPSITRMSLEFEIRICPQPDAPMVRQSQSRNSIGKNMTSETVTLVPSIEYLMIIREKTLTSDS